MTCDRTQSPIVSLNSTFMRSSILIPMPLLPMFPPTPCSMLHAHYHHHHHDDDDDNDNRDLRPPLIVPPASPRDTRGTQQERRLVGPSATCPSRSDPASCRKKCIGNFPSAAPFLELRHTGMESSISPSRPLEVPDERHSLWYSPGAAIISLIHLLDFWFNLG